MDLPKLEVCDTEGLQSSASTLDGKQEVTGSGHVIGMDRAVQKTRSIRHRTRNDDTVPDPSPLAEATGPILNEAQERDSKQKHKSVKKRRKTRRRVHGSMREGLVAGSQEAGEKASRNDLGILIVC